MTNNTSESPCAPYVLNDQEVQSLLPKLDVKSLMGTLFSSLARDNAVQPSQTLTPFPNNKGDYITYLGVLAEQGVFGAKLSPYIVTDGAPIITAWTHLMSMKTGMPLLLCDSGQLTVERTAGTTALAIDYLAKKESSHLALIGAGNVALAHLRHVISLRKWERITIFAPELIDNDIRQNEIRAIDNRIQIALHSSQATENADVIMLCTSAASAVISEQQIPQSALITSISTNAVNAHEVPPALLNKMDVYCDYKLTTPESAGEMKLAKDQHGWDKANIVGDLSDLVAQRCHLPDYKKPVFFRSIGLGLEDVAIAYGIWQLIDSKK
ncbi:ornithine cyclodeaminase family protein [Vibrio cortegadensis]|uniref:ornithine cyclodeaminase family protein n=1 Tax=Vibrio cortegadensis TaxID=1328770 RepID=UPI00352BED88